MSDVEGVLTVPMPEGGDEAPPKAKFTLVAKLLFALIIMVALALIGTGIALDRMGEIASETHDTAESTNRVAKRIEAQTSPEAIKRQQEQINGIIVTVDCNFRAALEEALEDLPDTVIAPDTITITDNCTPKEGQ